MTHFVAWFTRRNEDDDDDALLAAFLGEDFGPAEAGDKEEKRAVDNDDEYDRAIEDYISQLMPAEAVLVCNPKCTEPRRCYQMPNLVQPVCSCPPDM